MNIDDTLAEVTSSGEVSWRPYVETRAACATFLRNIPYDIQACAIRFGMWTYSDKEVCIYPPSLSYTHTIHAYTHTYTHAHTHIYIYICVCVCVYAYTYTNIFLFIKLHTVYIPIFTRMWGLKCEAPLLKYLFGFTSRQYKTPAYWPT